MCTFLRGDGVLGAHSEWRPVHEAQLRAYEAWCEEHGEITFEGDPDDPVKEAQPQELQRPKGKKARKNAEQSKV